LEKSPIAPLKKVIPTPMLKDVVYNYALAFKRYLMASRASRL